LIKKPLGKAKRGLAPGRSENELCFGYLHNTPPIFSGNSGKALSDPFSTSMPGSVPQRLDPGQEIAVFLSGSETSTPQRNIEGSFTLTPAQVEDLKTVSGHWEKIFK
jgi:hypothetical protein